MSVRMWIGNRLPSLADTIRSADTNAAVDLSATGLNATAVQLSMRALRSAPGSTPLIDHAAAAFVSAVAGTVRYDWSAADVTAIAADYAVHGSEYVFWWTLTAGGKTQDTPEADIVWAQHGDEASLIVPLTEMRQYLRTHASARPQLVDDDQLLRDLILAAGSAFETQTGHRLALETAISRSFSVTDLGNPLVDLHPWDLRTLTSVQLDLDLGAGLTLDQTQYRLEPRHAPYGVYTHVSISVGGPAAAHGWNWWGEPGQALASFGRQVTVLGNWGWSTVPEDVRLGAKMLVRRWLDAPSGARASSRGSTSFSFEGAALVGGADDDVSKKWAPYVRPSLDVF